MDERHHRRPGKVRRPRAVLMALILMSGLFIGQPGSRAQHPSLSGTVRLSTADRLRMLYAPQLNFTAGGDPIIRLGLMEGVSSLQFTPDRAIRVLPAGEGGPEIELPARRTYTIKASESKPGKYKHWVIVERVPISQRDRVKELRKKWIRRGYIPEVFDVGGLFAVKGKVFDSRVIFLTVGGMPQRRAASRLQTKLQAKYGIEGGMHSELVDYPSAMLTLTGAGVTAKIKHRDILQIVPKKGDEERIRYRIPNIARSYGKGFETRTYTGSLIVSPDASGKLVLSNNIGAERALKGVVPAEIHRTAPKAALQAQAIAARNEIFSAIGVRNLAEPYMLRSDVYDQVYGGVGVEHPRTSKAVDNTRGRVMFYKDHIVEAFYSSNAGGFTENNENVWAMEPRPYLRGRPDAPLDTVPVAFRDGISEAELAAFLKKGFTAYSKIAPVPSSRLFRWSRTVPVAKPMRWLRDAGYDVGRIKDVKILSRGVSGRVIRLKVTGDRGHAVIERELNVRKLFGRLRSGLFIMQQQKNARGYVTEVSFNGAGFGHGVGMCQTGAAGMASKGHDADGILRHYYRGIALKRLY